MRRPNIVMFLADDHARHSVGAYGSVVNRTPRIDEIAEHGVRFDRCYVTNSLCAPSRASILTGTYSHVNGVRGLRTHIECRAADVHHRARRRRIPHGDRRRVAHG